MSQYNAQGMPEVTRWTPVDLPGLRDEAAAMWWDFGGEVMTRMIRSNMVKVRPGRAAEVDGPYLAREEFHRLDRADLYHVTPDMTRLAMAAAETLPNFLLEAEDLPSDFGLVYFAEPVGAVPPDEDDPPEAQDFPLPIVAVAWGVMSTFPADWPNGGVWLTFYVDMTRVPAFQDRRERMRQQGKAHGMPRLSYNDEAAWPLGLPDVRPMGEMADRSLLARVGPILKATWLLMQQPLAAQTVVEPDRQARRRAERAGKQATAVRVISLRHAQSAAEPAGDGHREYHHRWVVRGHWRQQWMPSREVHRPIWINPHVKGPEDAPLLTGQKVYAWRR